MKQGKALWIRWGCLVLCCAILVTVSIVILNQKEGYYLDEYSSYGCANGEGSKVMAVDFGNTYDAEEIEEIAREHYSVSPDKRFNFAQVWANLGNNVHPPVFYAALHLVCSLTPGVFSVWQAGAVNIFFGLICLFFFQKIARGLVKSEWTAGVILLAWTGTLGMFADVLLLRDYQAATCGCVMVAWEAMRYLRGHRKVMDLVKLGLASAFAVLCHYYSAIYLFFLCAALCVMLMARKEWKDVFKIFAAEGCAAGVTIAVFPAIITRMFGSGRGAEATENLSSGNLGEFIRRTKEFFIQMNTSFFGNLLLICLGLILAAGAAYFLLKKKGKLPETGEAEEDAERRMTVRELALLAVPGGCYFVLVAKIAAFLLVRYMYMAMPMIWLSVAAFLLYFGRKLLKPGALALCMAVVLLTVSGMSWVKGKVPYLYTGMKARQEERLGPWTGIEAVQIWKGLNYTCVLLPQYEYYSTVSMYYGSLSDEELKAIPAFAEGRDVMLILGAKVEEKHFEKKLQELYPEYTCKKLGNLDRQSRFVNYVFYRTDDVVAED